MIRTRIYYFSIFAVWLILGCTQKSPSLYDSILDKAEQQNANYDSITNIDSIEMAVKYCDKEGTAKDRLRAHYLLGCAYRDAGEAPKALECFHDAADNADTTQADFDYMTLVKVHSQMAELLYHQMLPYDQLKELEYMRYYALKAGNARIAINAFEHKAGVYELLNLPDSEINIRQRAYTEYKKHGYDKEAAMAIGPTARLYINKGLLKEAKFCLDTYEKEIGVVKDGEVNERKAIYYYHKGIYYLAIDMVDSAQFYFQKLAIPSSLSPDNVEAGYRGLYLLYKKKGQKDSLAKYADLSYLINDSIYTFSAKNDIQKMQTLYNYSRSQKEAIAMKDKANKNRTYFMIALVLGILVACVGFVAWIIAGQKKKEAINNLKNNYAHEKQNLEKTKNDLLKLKDEEYTQLKEEKNLALAEHERRIQEYEKILNIRKNKAKKEELQATSIYHRIKQILKYPKKGMIRDDWKDLEQMIDENIPTFYQTLKRLYPKLNKSDYRMCMLIRLGFTPSEISILTNTPNSTISMKRSRLLFSMFQNEGKPEDFDKRIQEIS